MISTFPVLWPGFKTDVPEKTSTWTSVSLRRAKPTSMSSFTGCPIRIPEVFDLGAKRTRPALVRMFTNLIFRLFNKLTFEWICRHLELGTSCREQVAQSSDNNCCPLY